MVRSYKHFEPNHNIEIVIQSYENFLQTKLQSKIDDV